MSICPTIDLGSRPNAERPEAVHEAAELFIEHGCILVKRAFDQDYVAQLHRAYLETYYPFFEDREFSDALNVGDKRTQVTVAIEGPFNSPQLYANQCILLSHYPAKLAKPVLKEREEVFIRRTGAGR